MATIYSAPEHIKKPSFNIDTFHEDEEKYIKELRDFALNRNSGKYVGETIKFQVADSYAVYMVLSMNPLELMHMPIGDEWTFEHVDLMTPERVKEMIQYERELAKLFAKSK